MRRLTGDPFPGFSLTSDAAEMLINELKERLQPAISTLDDPPARELPQFLPVRLVVNGQAVLELTAREALDLYFAFKQLVEDGASGTAEHTHVNTHDYADEFAVWIDPHSENTAGIL
jgi:hypothetical protein